MSNMLLSTSFRFYENNPTEVKAYEHLKRLCQEQHMSYGKAIALAINAYCDGPTVKHAFTADEREQIRAIIREELSVSAIYLNGLMNALGRVEIPEEPAENYEPSTEELNESLSLFN